MPSFAPTASQRTAGSLLGLALGDAMGAPYEGGWAERALWRLLGTTRDGLRRTTDDTQMSRDLAQSLLACQGLQADDAALRFARSYRWHRGYGPGAAKVLKHIAAGMPWQQARLQVYPQGSWGNGGAMRAPVVALWVQSQLPGDCALSVALAREQAAITHAHPLAQDGAALIAAAVHSAWDLHLPALQPAAWLRQVVRDAALVQTDTWQPRIDQALAWLQCTHPTPTPAEVAAALGHGISALDSCVTALYVAARFLRQDFASLVDFVQRMGGDTDTIAAMAGSIYGAAQGEQALPPRWLAALEDCAELRQLARELAPAPAWLAGAA